MSKPAKDTIKKLQQMTSEYNRLVDESGIGSHQPMFKHISEAETMLADIKEKIRKDIQKGVGMDPENPHKPDSLENVNAKMTKTEKKKVAKKKKVVKAKPKPKAKKAKKAKKTAPKKEVKKSVKPKPKKVKAKPQKEVKIKTKPKAKPKPKPAPKKEVKSKTNSKDTVEGVIAHMIKEKKTEAEVIAEVMKRFPKLNKRRVKTYYQFNLFKLRKKK